MESVRFSHPDQHFSKSDAVVIEGNQMALFYHFYYNFVSHADELCLADVVSLSDLTVFHMGSFIQSVVYHSVSQIHTAIQMC